MFLAIKDYFEHITKNNLYKKNRRYTFYKNYYETGYKHNCLKIN